jgi:hypothetical protein
MPLKGYLSVFNTTQLLNLINLSKRTGSLHIYEGVETGEKLTLGDGLTKIEKLKPGRQLVNLAFKDGMLVFAEMDGKDGHLAGILQRAGKLNEEQSKQIRSRAESLNMNDKGLALSLINAKYVTQKDILQSIQKHTVSIVFDLAAWKKEPFEFVDGQNPPDSRILVPIDLKDIIIQITRLESERAKLEEEIPSLEDVALKIAGDPSEFKKVKLSANEWRVVGFINPNNSIRQIAKACNMTDTEIRKIVYGLLQAGLVQMVKLQRQQDRMRRPGLPPSKVAAPDRDVVNRLIDKIRSMKAPS